MPSPDHPQATEPVSVEQALAQLETALASAPQDPDHPGFTLLDDDVRWRLHVAACSIRDMTFWVRESPTRPGVFEATEVETGVTVHGPTAEAAMISYFNQQPTAAAEPGDAKSAEELVAILAATPDPAHPDDTDVVQADAFRRLREQARNLTS